MSLLSNNSRVRLCGKKRGEMQAGFAPFLIIAIAAALYAAGVAYVGVQHQAQDTSKKQSEIERRLEEISVLHKQPSPQASPEVNAATTSPAIDFQPPPTSSTSPVISPVPTPVIRPSPSHPVLPWPHTPAKEITL